MIRISALVALLCLAAGTWAQEPQGEEAPVQNADAPADGAQQQERRHDGKPKRQHSRRVDVAVPVAPGVSVAVGVGKGGPSVGAKAGVGPLSAGAEVSRHGVSTSAGADKTLPGGVGVGVSSSGSK